MKPLIRKTPRLTVRPLELKDYESWKNANLTMSSPKNIWDRGARSSKELSRPQYKKMLNGQRERRKKDTYYDLGVFENTTKALIGGVSIMEVARERSQTAFLGYRLFNNYWGKGYAKEAVKAMIEIGFKDIKLHRIEAGIEPGNLRSISLAKSLGMRREGLKKRALYLRETWVDLLIYTLTCEDLRLKFDGKLLKVNLRS